jgi:HEAT repeat protein
VLFVAVCFVGCGQARVDTLIEAANSADLSTRRAALREIAEMGAEGRAATDTLVKLSRDADAEIRRLCCLALGNMYGIATEPHVDIPAAVAVSVTECVSDKETSVRMTAAYALLAIEPTHVAAQELLAKAMLRGDGGVIDRLGKQTPPPTWAVPTLIAILKSDRRPGNRRLAAVALGRIGVATNAGVTALQAARGDADDRVRSAAEDALAALGQKSVDELTLSTSR